MNGACIIYFYLSVLIDTVLDFPVVESDFNDLLIISFSRQKSNLSCSESTCGILKQSSEANLRT
jgi:hypothetical protein